MIKSAAGYISFLIFFSAIVIMITSESKSKIFKYIPSIVLIYFLIMILSTLGLWEDNLEIQSIYLNVKDNLLLAMIFLMLLKCDIREIIKLGPKMIFAFLISATTIVIAFILTYSIFKNYYEPNAWKAFGALAGTWLGGTGNMLAVQNALSIPDSLLGYTLLMDSVNYSLWVMLLLWMVSFAPKFNKWTKADTKSIDNIGYNPMKNNNKKGEVTFTNLIFMLGMSLSVASIATKIGQLIPENQIIQGNTVAILLVTLIGVIIAMTPISKIPSSSELANLMLYIIVALIASKANFTEISGAPIYIISGTIILLIHGALLILIAKVFRLDLFTCGIASLSNIGGLASAPILAASYNEALIPIGVLMSLMGYVLGTGGGLLVAKILSLL
ncbi:DUF819 domain-containing protein [Clostridium ihumii]|uniref:DUF819 family protein n=1 Tax=Clostridium ihumii TaxID=1470356 RepID=UPI00058EC12E|nr:DUF819 family protein [Clostridium ihumii]